MPDGNVQPKYLRDGRKSARRYFPCTGNNCVTGQWRDDPDMLVERWYPTIATLADGTAIIISGSTDSLDFSKDTELIKNPTYEYYPPKRTGGWPRNLEILNWAHPMNLYPMVYQLPSGGVFLFVANKTVVIDPRDESISTPFPDLYSPGHLPWIYPYTPTMVMLPLLQKNDFEAELMVCGGSRLNGNTPVSSNECWKLNTDSAAPQWNREQDMPAARVMVDSAILPGIYLKLQTTKRGFLTVIHAQMVQFSLSMEQDGVLPGVQEVRQTMLVTLSSKQVSTIQRHLRGDDGLT